MFSTRCQLVVYMLFIIFSIGVIGQRSDTQAVNSTGEYSNPQAVWAVGIENLTFIYYCEPTITSSTYVSWFPDHGTLQQSVSFSGGKFYYDFPNGTEYGLVTAEKNGTGYITRYIIYKLLDDSLNNTKLDVSASYCKPNGFKIQMLILKHCDKVIVNDVHALNVEVNGNATYDTNGNCTCQNPNATLFNSDGIELSDVTAVCNKFAVWEGCDIAECWYAPTNITAYQKPVYSNTTANLSCSFTPGFPNKTSEVFYISGKIVSKTKRLEADDHDKPYYCEVQNDYTTKTEKIARSPIKRLTVYFAPIISKLNEKEIYIERNKSRTVSFYVRANPANGGVTTTFSIPNGTKTTDTYSDTSNVSFVFSYTIEISSKEDYGYYNFVVETTDPKDSAYETIRIVGDDDGTNSNIVAIAAGCGGAVLLIVALVITLMIYRRRNRKSESESHIKEERQNPIYGSAPGPSDSTEYASADKSKKTRNTNGKQEKEEKINPLYQGTSATGDTVEEAYAAIDKKKKKEKRNTGSENTAFAPEVMYAAVNKPKKNKNTESQPDVVYSAVQKKKKNGQPSDTGLHG